MRCKFKTFGVQTRCMAEIALLGIEFKGYHGLYPEEKIQGNRFVLDLIARSPHPKEGGQAAPGNYVLGKVWPDYARMHQLAEAVYTQPAELLEEVASGILAAFKKEWPTWTFEVALTKCNPPITALDPQCTLNIPLSRVTLRCSDL